LAWAFVKSVLYEGIDKFVPMNKNNSWRKKPSWNHPITYDFKKIIRKKHRLWTRYQETKNHLIYKDFKRIRNIVRNESRKITQLEQRSIAKIM
jgi:hypothetical protein